MGTSEGHDMGSAVTKYWSEAQHLAAEWFKTHGWPHARAVGSGRQGADVENMAGLAPEVKAEQGWRPTLWLRQADSHGGLPFVIYRPHGFGPASIARWPVIMTLETATALLLGNGYGDGWAAMEHSHRCQLYPGRDCPGCVGICLRVNRAIGDDDDTA